MLSVDTINNYWEQRRKNVRGNEIEIIIQFNTTNNIEIENRE